MEQFYNQCEILNKPGTIMFNQELTDQWDKFVASVPSDVSPEWAQLILFAVGAGKFPEGLNSALRHNLPSSFLAVGVQPITRLRPAIYRTGTSGMSNSEPSTKPPLFSNFSTSFCVNFSNLNLVVSMK